MRGRNATREADERLLRMLRLRHKGWSPTRIMRAYEPHLWPGNIDTLTKRARDADVKESGEPEAIVLAAYWTTRNRK